ncbi:MAG: peroxiredoxin [Legionellales bacterium]|nr:peroxiredoxin [Legionellales bacterium]|tara:strand:+ start:4795 stop:5268 length:474 start_codon:yes stop_codon:yes gene_type:complete
MTDVTIGKKAPDFTLESTSGETVQLKQLRGRNVVLYFYPRDNTPGCTTESQDFAANYKKFQKLEAEVFGISRDTIASHHKFKDKFDFPFELLSDNDETVCNLYGVMKQKNMYGKKVWGIERSTFIIDKDGKLVHEWRKVKVPGHVDEVLETVSEMFA